MGYTRSTRLAFNLFLLLILVAIAPAAMSDDEPEWDEAELFFELNNTDGDLGIHANRRRPLEAAYHRGYARRP